MTVHVRVLGTNFETGVGPCLLIVTKTSRILVNVGEGLLRLSEEHVKLNKLTHILLTKVDWNSWSGILDLAYYLEKTKLKIEVYGPQGLIDFTMASRYFLFCPNLLLALHEVLLDGCKIRVGEVKEELQIEILLLNHESIKTTMQRADEGTVMTEMINPLFVDLMEVQKMYLDEQEKLKAERLLTNVLGKPLSQQSLRSQFGTEEDGKMNTYELTLNFERPTRFLPPQNSHQVLCYIVKTPSIPPKFDPKKASELGVPKGPLFGKLTKGESIILPNGVKVHPHQCVIGDVLPGPTLIIVCCPTSAYENSLYSHPGWKMYQSETIPSTINLVCVIHMTPLFILRKDSYVRWLLKFPNSVKHVFLHEDASDSIVFRRSHELVERLKILDPISFTSSQDFIGNDVFTSKFKTFKDTYNLPSTYDICKDERLSSCNRVNGEFMMKFHLLPLRIVGLDVSEVFPKANFDYDLEFSKIFGFDAKISEFRRLMATPESNNPLVGIIGRGDVVLHVLGTSAAQPTHSRNGYRLFLLFLDHLPWHLSHIDSLLLSLYPFPPSRLSFFYLLPPLLYTILFFHISLSLPALSPLGGGWWWR
eukprot:TRINITY_DN6095_c0_g1_i1.p1 TRINITY_DN6095_c0_g1~~TRINITY_DN6095_c0_g1_i1.p1  ORF type:complete len:604 (-),score=120.11 TRINITY_DN6095_c0_g1_i1:1127-2896(-)